MQTAVSRSGSVRVRSILFVVFFVVLASVGPAESGRFEMVLETDVDASAGSEVYLITYGSLTEVMSNSQSGAGFTAMDVSSAFSVAGFAADGEKYAMVLESDTDQDGGAELFVITYNSLADVKSNTQAGAEFTPLNVNGTYDVGGFASDGEKYYLVLESITDVPGGTELLIVTFDSLADVISNNQSSARFSNINVPSGSSMAGFASDGETFFMVLESDTNQAGGAEVKVTTYNSMADFLSDDRSADGFSALDVSADYGIGGFAEDMPIFFDGFESADTSEWSSTVGGS